MITEKTLKKVIKKSLNDNNKENNKILFKKIEKEVSDLALITREQTQRIRSSLNTKFTKLDSRIRGLGTRLDYHAENYVKKPSTKPS